MKHEILKIDEQKKIMRITTVDERWYSKPTSADNDEPVFYPSVTWIAEYYPKGIAFYKWLADKGWDEAESIKAAAGNKGSKVHRACKDIDNGKEVKFNDKYMNYETGKEEELTVEEWECLMSFRAWLDAVKPELVEVEVTVFNEREHYAGTIDRIYKIKDEHWIVDLKTSQYIWPSHKIQISAYAHTRVDQRCPFKLGILQLGFKRNRNGYKFTEVEDQYDLFLNAKAIWHNENPDAKPKQRDYPLSIAAECRRKEK